MFDKGDTAPVEEQDDVFSDDFDLGEEESDEDESDGNNGDDEDDSNEKEAETKKPDNSAIHQKKRYRAKLQEAEQRIAELEARTKQDGQLSAEQQKEKQAEEFLATKIREVLGLLDAEKQQKTQAEQEAFEQEIEEVLDENSDITEDDLRAVADELEISPTQAAKVIARERKLTKRAKPDMPKERRASNSSKQSVKEAEKPKSLDGINRRIKELLSRGEL